MPALRSRVTTHGRNAAGARSLWRATGMTDGDFGKPIVAIANSYTQFVPGHVHLKDVGDIVADGGARGRRRAARVPHHRRRRRHRDGPRRHALLAAQPRAHRRLRRVHGQRALPPTRWSASPTATRSRPGMLNAALRLNIPTVFVSGGPMEAGKAVVVDGVAHAPTDLITAISASADRRTSTTRASTIVERSACPTCGSCSGMFTANSMNCLTEALGLALPGNGSTLATHAARRALFERAGRTVVELATRWYARRRRVGAAAHIATRRRVRATRWRSTSRWAARPTRCCTSSPPRRRARSTSTWPTSTPSRRRVPCLAKVAPNSDYHMEDVHRAGGIPAILGELRRAGLLQRGRPHRALAVACATGSTTWDVRASAPSAEAVELFHAAPGGVRTTEAFSTTNRWSALDTDAAGGCIRDVEHAYTTRRRAGRAARQHRRPTAR